MESMPEKNRHMFFKQSSVNPGILACSLTRAPPGDYSALVTAATTFLRPPKRLREGGRLDGAADVLLRLNCIGRYPYLISTDISFRSRSLMAS